MSCGEIPVSAAKTNNRMYADARHRIELFPELARVHSDPVDLTFEIRMTKRSNAQADFEFALVVGAGARCNHSKAG